ncbi:hypothetical protein [Yeosuana sp.]|uniref:hypothetical protein n=1 Tax=Yeosuana sp. TaxID=2529388 RepID=UPI004054C6F9
MKLKFEIFNTHVMGENELYPISGGTSQTKCGDYMTRSSGADGDGTNFDGDADFY